MTEIREPHFGIDLPGEWEQAESEEAATTVYRETNGTGILSVTLLGVRPVYSIADPGRLLDDYLHHRSHFEQGRAESLVQSEPVSRQVSEGFEGGWSGHDPVSGRRLRHRVLLLGGMLADFAYESTGMDEAAFGEQAEAILASATASPE